MKLLSAQQIHEWDAFTIANEPISSIDLTERAATACTGYLMQNFQKNRFKIFCGKGNNGGDGLAIARQLLKYNFDASVFIIESGKPGSGDFQTNLERLQNVTTNIHFIQSAENLPLINKEDVVIDALYGSGLNRPLTGLSAGIIEHINKSNATIISVDIPGGMFLDKSSKGNAVIKARSTLTFQCLKLCFLVAENAPFFGEVKVLDIGLHPDFLNEAETTYGITDAEFIKKIYQPRESFSNKGTYGHAQIIAGNTGKMGAGLMATFACIRAGAGLTTLNAPEAFFNIIYGYLPEAMCAAREDELDFEKINAVGIGPGLGTTDDTLKLLKNVFHQFKKPMVIDADALNTIAKNDYLFNDVAAESILTPHPKEFERLFGEATNDFERLETAIQQSVKHNLVIILKGNYTLVAKNGKGWFNTTGNSGLAKGGSGDMLTGMITALLAQHYEPVNAARFGVYLHGLAADLALQEQSEESMMVTDVIKCLGAAFKTLQSNQ